PVVATATKPGGKDEPAAADATAG
ncbi:MAG: hypothetical protein RIR28_885, partial [Pseudomonadota bacterium]